MHHVERWNSFNSPDQWMDRCWMFVYNYCCSLGYRAKRGRLSHLGWWTVLPLSFWFLFLSLTISFLPCLLGWGGGWRSKKRTDEAGRPDQYLVTSVWNSGCISRCNVDLRNDLVTKKECNWEERCEQTELPDRHLSTQGRKWPLLLGRPSH